MSGEITSRTVHKDQEGDTEKRSKSLNEVKSFKNIRIRVFYRHIQCKRESFLSINCKTLLISVLESFQIKGRYPQW